MKTKVIEHEWVSLDETDGSTSTETLIAVKQPGIRWQFPDAPEGGADGFVWQVNGTNLRVFGAEEAREYIKLFEKIIEAEENGD